MVVGGPTAWWGQHRTSGPGRRRRQREVSDCDRGAPCCRSSSRRGASGSRARVPSCDVSVAEGRLVCATPSQFSEWANDLGTRAKRAASPPLLGPRHGGSFFGMHTGTSPQPNSCRAMSSPKKFLKIGAPSCPRSRGSAKCNPQHDDLGGVGSGVNVQPCWVSMSNARAATMVKCAATHWSLPCTFVAPAACRSVWSASASLKA
jgi:hypothetical protein